MGPEGKPRTRLTPMSPTPVQRAVIRVALEGHGGHWPTDSVAASTTAGSSRGSPSEATMHACIGASRIDFQKSSHKIPVPNIRQFPDASNLWLKPVPVGSRQLPGVVVGHIERQACRRSIESLVSLNDQGEVGPLRGIKTQR